MKKVTTWVLMLCLVLWGALCYASGAAGTENEKGKDGTPNDIEHADALGRKVIDLRLNETSGGGYVRLCALNLDMYKVNCSGAEEGGGQ